MMCHEKQKKLDFAGFFVKLSIDIFVRLYYQSIVS